MLVELKQKSQVTIPSELVKKMNLRPGDKLEVVEQDYNVPACQDTKFDLLR